ncbi:hypothetical protein DSUL_90098 [Desulfovibrionales bacterium]
MSRVVATSILYESNLVELRLKEDEERLSYLAESTSSVIIFRIHKVAASPLINISSRLLVCVFLYESLVEVFTISFTKDK